MKRILKSLFIVFVLSSCVWGQADKSFIIHSNKYYYGTGVSQDINEAGDQALKELISQIAIRVTSDFRQKVSESGDALDINVESIVKTHSAATLENVKTIKHPTSDGQMEVFCYLEKSKVTKIFEERKKLIAEMVHTADKYAGEYNIAYALKLYYFAAILLNSLPDQNVTYHKVNYTTIIPERINEIILNTELEFLRDFKSDKKEREIILEVNYKGKPAALLDFTFWDGSNQVSVKARDGLAAFYLLGPSVGFDELDVNIKYSYYECKDEYNIVASLWDLVNKPVFNCQKNVLLIKKEISEEVQSTEKKTGYSIILSCRETESPKKQIIKATESFLEVVSKTDSSEISRLYASDPFLYNKISNYIKYNNSRPLDREIFADLNKTATGWELRRLRMHHKYPSIHKETTEYMVLDFSENGELIDLNVSTSDYLYQKFVKDAEFGSDWGNRQEIIKFLEKYRTAYMVRDIKTVDMMFAEEALIIIGRMIKTKVLPPDMVKYQQLGNEPDVEYIRMAKSEYMERQKKVFESQSDIFLDFGSFNIIKKNKAPNIYGVEMRQSYNSTTYSDEGYLFLLIDFNEEDPLIYVRAWQPNAWNNDELIRTANFRIFK